MIAICTPPRVNRIKLFCQVLFIAVLLAMSRQAVAAIRYVKAGASGTGVSWSNASGDLQAMINAAGNGDEIWVAGGRYIPNRRADATATITTGDRNNAFVLKSGVKIYGGFAGNETTLSQRNLALTANTSILSGDLNANDNGFINNSENAYHVVISAASTDISTRLDGFTIQGGNSAGGAAITINGQSVGADRGGGIVVSSSSPTLQNLIVKQNAAFYGAGMGISSSSLALINSTICGNAGNYGGGVLCSTCQAAFTNVLICGNTATAQGGGMYNEFGNVAPVLTNVTISGNTATISGGALYNNLVDSLKIRNSIVYGNNTGIVNNSGTPSIQYSLVQGETSTANSNINGSIDPLFVNPLSPGLNTGGNYSLQPCSAGVNRGNNDYYTPYMPPIPYLPDGSKNFNDTPVKKIPYLFDITTDLASAARFYNGGTADLGAYERQGGVTVPPGSAGIVYVKAGGAGTGASWDCATGDLQAAINVVSSGNQVWVAEGVYQPATGQSFIMKEGVKMYGGFTGTETAINLRAPGNRSVLTGNQEAVIKNYNNNLTAAALLDGFAITNGTKSGVYNYNSSPAFVNCDFYMNTADMGGGMNNSSYSSPTLTNCTFTNNTATTFGGGMYNSDYCSPTLTNCNFNNNETSSTLSEGGGMYVQNNCSPTLTNCSFSYNTTNYGGGGIFVNRNCSSTLTGCTFTGNTVSGGAGYGAGGGIYNYYNSHLFISNSTFINNSAKSAGGAMNNDSSSLVLRSCTIQSNTANSGGGLSNSKTVSISIISCLISGNEAINEGGGMSNYNIGSSLNVINCTISGNTSKYGGAISSSFTNGPYISNSIIYNNSSGLDNTSSYPVIAYSLVQGYTTTSNNNISGNTNPLFVGSMPPMLSFGGDYHLQPCSPVLDMGSNSYVGAQLIDAGGNPRLYNNGTVDMGAYEMQTVTDATASAVGIVYVMAGANGSGKSWSCASGDLQAAINAAPSGGQVWVTMGTYTPNRRADAVTTITPGDRNNAFVLKRDVKIYGGFMGMESALNDRAPGPITILSGDLNKDDNGFANNSENAYSVVMSTGNVSTAVLDGFTIQGGNGDIGGGGGIMCSNSSPTLNRLIIKGNAGRYGAGLCLSSASPAITNSYIYGNAGYYGGGVLASNSGASFTNVVISGNTAVEQGGGMYNEFAVAPTLTNVTIAGNTANYNSGAMYNNLGPALQIRNSIIYGNGSGIINNNGTPNIQYSLVQGEPSTTNGNISGTTDPLFIYAPGPGLTIDGIYSLQMCSPVINMGSNAVYKIGQIPDLTSITTDLVTNARNYNNEIVDMGAYELPGTLVTGAGLLANNGDVKVTIASGKTPIGPTPCILITTLLPTGTTTPLTGSVSASVWIESTQPSAFVKRHYEITPFTNAGTATARVTLYFTQDEFNAFNAVNALHLPTSASDIIGISNLLIEKRPGTSSDGTGLPATYNSIPVTINPTDADIIWNSPYNRWEVSFDVTGFGGFFVKTQSFALPLTLLSFNGSKQNGYNKLQWVTSDEINTSYFALERSVDGAAFTQAATIPAARYGTTYSYNDYYTFTGRIYYRLKMTDADGHYTYSPVISLVNNGNSAITIYPNPANNVVHINTGNSFLYSKACLYDVNGRLLQTFVIATNPQAFSVQRLTTGLYILKFADGTMQKFIKE